MCEELCEVYFVSNKIGFVGLKSFAIVCFKINGFFFNLKILISLEKYRGLHEIELQKTRYSHVIPSHKQ